MILSVSVVVLCCVVMVFRSASCWWHRESQSTPSLSSGSSTTPKVNSDPQWPRTLSDLWHFSDMNLILWLSTGSEEEAQALSRALLLLKELISSVDKEVLELDRTRRLQEIQARLDPRAQAEVQGGGVFRGGELLRRRLLHEGTLLWKVQGSRMKGSGSWYCTTSFVGGAYTSHRLLYVFLQMCRSCWCLTSWSSFRRKIRSSLLHHWLVTSEQTCTSSCFYSCSLHQSVHLPSPLISLMGISRCSRIWNPLSVQIDRSR